MYDWVWPAAGAGAALGAIYLALAYMAAKYFQSQQLQTYTKLEIEQYVLSAVLIAIVLALVFGRVEILTTLTGAYSPDYSALGVLDKMHSSLFSLVEGIATNTFYISKVIGYNYNYQVAQVLPYATSGAATPSAGASPLMSALVLGSDAIVMLMYFVKAEYLFYVFMGVFASGTFLIPLGILLRFIPPTRKIGGILLGGGIALSLAFPAVILWGDLIFDALYPDGSMAIVKPPGDAPENSVVCSEAVAVPAAIGEIVGPTAICLFFPDASTPSQPAPIGPGVFGCKYIVSIVWWFIKYLFSSTMSSYLSSNSMVLSQDSLITDYYEPLVDNAFPFALQGALAAISTIILHMVVLILIAKNLATFFGNEGEIYGLSKII